MPARAKAPPVAPSAEEPPEEEECASNFYLKAVFMACVLVELWRHHYLLGLLPVAMIYYTIKKTSELAIEKLLSLEQ